MKITRILIVPCVALTLTLGVVAGSAYADGTKPYGDNVTGHIANRLHGTHRGAWLATILDQGGYRGPRHAEEVKIASGHGRRWVGIIHVSSGKAAKARKALAGQWFAERGTLFVLPLRSNDWTSGGTSDTYRTAARWAKKRLGSGWTVVAP